MGRHLPNNRRKDSQRGTHCRAYLQNEISIINKQVPSHHKAGDKFKQGSEKKSDKRSDSSAKGLFGLIAGDHFTYEGTEKRPRYYPPRGKEYSCNQPDGAAPHPVLASAEFL